VKHAVICACLLSLLTPLAYAEKTVYVVDQITITLRSGQGTQHQILRTLPSGSPLQVLGANEETGYTHVRTKDGVEGWVLSQYLIDEPTSKIKLTTAEQKLARLDAENRELKAKFEAVVREKDAWEQEKLGLAAQRDRLEQEQAKLQTLAATPAQTEAEVLELPPEKQAEMLRQENQLLKDRAKKDWFFAGGGVMLLGIIFGLILSRIRLRKSGWGDTL
jgi:SH3 domain protein